MPMNNILQARLLGQVEKRSIADVIGTRAVERTGYSARFAPVVAGGVKKYDGKVEWEQAEVVPLELTLKNRDYFAFIMDDIEALKTNVAEIDKQAQKQSRQIVMEENTRVLAKISAGAGKTITRTIKTPAQAYDMIVDANNELLSKGAKHDNRFIIIGYDILGMLEKDDRFTRYETILSNGIVEGTHINGAKLIVTNSLPVDTALAVQKDGVGFERFLDKVQVLPVLDNQFGSGFRGLNVYDSVVLDKDCIIRVSLKGEVETK